MGCFILFLFINYPFNYSNVNPSPEIPKVSPTPYATPITITTTQPTIPPTSIPTTISPNYQVGLTTKQFTYILNGVSHTVSLQMYSGIVNELSSKKSPVACWRKSGDTSPCNLQEMEQYYLAYMNEPIQEKEIDHLVSIIKNQTSNRNDQAKIAIRLVQNLDYDTEKSKLNSVTIRYPYQTLYDKMGICSEKSLLLAELLDKLGFDTVIFHFEPESHAAVGVKCDPKYAYKETGYCFIESTVPSMITDSSNDYIGVGKLTSTPVIYHISSGSTLSEIEEEYKDTLNWYRIKSLGKILDDKNYSEWKALVKKYGIKLSSS